MQSLQMPAFRPLYYALFVSAALHLYVLWPRTLLERAQSQTLQAHLRPAVQPLTPDARAPERPATAVARSRKAAPPAARESATAAPSLALPTAESGLDAGGLRAYRTALALDLRRSGLLRQSLTSTMRGRLEMEIVMSEQGQILALGIAKGSGDQVLDQLALRALRESAPHTALPAVLLGRMFRLVLPLEVE